MITIRIYKPLNDYKCIKEISRHTDIKTYIWELSNGIIISWAEDQTIFIGEHIIKILIFWSWIKLLHFQIIKLHPVQMFFNKDLEECFIIKYLMQLKQEA